MFIQIYHFIKAEILRNQIAYEEYLPSIRSCAQSLAVSKNTVEVAYQLLVSEGYVTSIPKKGYQVAKEKITLDDHVEQSIIAKLRELGEKYELALP